MITTYAIITIDNGTMVFRSTFPHFSNMNKIPDGDWMDIAKAYGEGVGDYKRDMRGANYTVSAYPARGYAVIFRMGYPVAKVLPLAPFEGKKHNREDYRLCAMYNHCSSHNDCEKD